MDTINSSITQCPHCSASANAADTFCAECGKELIASEIAENEDVFSILSPTLLYYFITLVILVSFKVTDLFPKGFEGMVVITAIDVALVIAFWIYFFNDLKPLFSLSNIKLQPLVITITGAIVGSIVVSFIADLIKVSISDDVFYDTYMFEDTTHPFLISVLFICVQPAIFEEVAFRGFLFTNIRKLTSPMSTVYVTAFIFGIIHLAVISLLWLVPLGLAFAFLRMKYNTLWYGMIGHFTYNFGIIAIEFYEAANLPD